MHIVFKPCLQDEKKEIKSDTTDISDVANTTLRLTLSARYTKADTYAFRVDPDETARIEPSYQDLH